MGDRSKPNGLVDRAETMLLGFASGALTGAACLAVVKRQFVRRQSQPKAQLDTSAAKKSALNAHNELAATGCQAADGTQATVSIFQSGPLQQASNFLHQIKSARAAAAASVAEFKHLVSLQRLGCIEASQDLLQEHLDALEAELMSSSSLVGEPNSDHAVGEQDQQLSDCSAMLCMETEQQAGPPQLAQQCDEGHLLRQQLAAAQAEAADANVQLVCVRSQLEAAQQELHELHMGRAELHAGMQDVQECVSSLALQVQEAEMRYKAAEQQLSIAVQTMQQLLLQAAQQQQELQLQVAAETHKAAPDSALQATREQPQETCTTHLHEVVGADVTAVHQQLQCYAAAQQQLLTALAQLSSQTLQVECTAEHLDAHATQVMVQQRHQCLQQQQLQRHRKLPMAAAQAAPGMELDLGVVKPLLQEAASFGQLLQHELAVLQQQLSGVGPAAAAASRLGQLAQQLHSSTDLYQSELAAAQAELQAHHRAAAEQDQERQQRLEQLQQLREHLDITASQLAEAEQQVLGLQCTATTRLEMLQAAEAQLADAREQLEQYEAAQTAMLCQQDHQQQQQVRDGVEGSQAHSPLRVGESTAGGDDITCPHAQSLQTQQGSTGTFSGNVPSLTAAEAGPAHVAAQLAALSPEKASSTPVNSTLPWGCALREVGRTAVLLSDASQAALSSHKATTFLPDRSLMPLIQQPTAAPPAAAAAPASSLLVELQHESDELAEQLTRLQQYLKTTSAKYGDLHSIEAMDEGLQKLRRVTDGVVSVATSTVERVSCGGGNVRSAPVSFTGRAPSSAGAALLAQHQNHASDAGAPRLGKDEGEEVAAECSRVPLPPRSVAMRRLGLELPRLESWGSATIPVETVLLPAPAGDCSTASSEQTPPASAAEMINHSQASGASPPAAADGLCSGPADGSCLENWGSEMSEAACNWLAGHLHVDEELASFPGTPVEPWTASPSLLHPAAAAVRVPSRLAAVSMAAAQANRSSLAAWGSGMLPFSGAGSAVQEQQQQQQEATPASGLRQPPSLAGCNSPGTLQLQLQDALEEVRQLHSERSMLQTQVLQLTELAQQQEDTLTVNTQLLEVLTAGLLDDGLSHLQALALAEAADEAAADPAKAGV